jgi:hypothetical protein
MIKVALKIAGIVLAALGLVVVLMALLMPEVPIAGLDLQLGALLLIGGILVIGIGAAVAAVDELRLLLSGDEPMPQAPPAFRPSPAPTPPGLGERMHDRSAERPKRQDKTQGGMRPLNGDQPPRFAEEPAFGRHHGSRDLARSSIDRVIEEVRDLGGSATAEIDAANDIVSEEELYVVDERTIAGKQARILSDGTVEAETDEGWMRFENVDHLQEYMDAVRRQRGI